MSRWHGRFEALHDNDEVLVVRYEDVVADPESTLATVWDQLGVAPVAVSTEFSYYFRRDYIGNTIDPQRDAQLMDVLSADDRGQIARHCRPVLKRHYPELAVLAS